MTRADPNQLLLAGVQAERQGDFQQAESLYRQALTANPNHPGALNAMGALAIQFNQPQMGCDLLRRAIAIDPSHVDFHMNLGSALRMLQQYDQALVSAQQAVAMAPQLPGPYTLLGVVLTDLSRLEEALAACLRAQQIDPEYEGPLNLLLSSLYGKLLRPRDAIAAADRVLARDPNHLGAHWNKGFAALAAGEFAVGWEEFEWRLEYAPHLRRDFPQPQWKRQDLTGKTILLHCEGGFGDAIHFVRFLPEVAKRAKSVVLECPQALYDLFACNVQGLVIPRGQPLPVFDFHCPLQSLPYNLGAEILTTAPYLRADPQKAARLQPRIGSDPLRVGLAWAGSAMATDPRTRTLATFAPLASVAAVKFFTLQVGADAAQASHAPAGMCLHDLTADLHDFSDLAAAISKLDLVISVDTSVAHLAGAMGKPTWVLIPFVPDFRWMLDRSDSPWYPTMRLYRQANRTDWNQPVAQMTADLQHFKNNKP